MKLKILVVIIASLVAIFPRVQSQDVETLLSKYTQENGQGYTQPLADVLGASFNSGLFHSAKVKKMGFQVYLGVSSSVAFIPDKRKTFEASPEGLFNALNPQDLPVEVPTIFGEVETVSVPGQGGTTYLFPAGLNVNMVPLAVPQLTVGSVFGTDLTVRYFALGLNEDFEDLSIFGWGLRHSISQHIPAIPLELAAGMYFQNFNLGDYASAKAMLFNVQASKKLMIFTFYGGLGYEKSTLDITYNDPDENTDIRLNLDGKNSIRLTTGVTFNLGPVKLNVDYNFASQSILSLGLGLGFGD